LMQLLRAILSWLQGVQVKSAGAGKHSSCVEGRCWGV
jgi:hypothetical protein